MPKPRPTPELARLQERLNKLLEQALLGGGGPLQGGQEGPQWRPLVDLVETSEAYVLYAELPGVERSDIQLDSDGSSLDLSGQRRPLGGGRGYLRLEGTHGPFRRRLDLPEPVDADRISAHFERGILVVTMPKRVPRGTEVPIREA
jgi:HSP20 family protein